MPCCILCTHYTLADGQPRVDKECPGYIKDNAPPRWYLLKEAATCCPNCKIFEEDPAKRKWRCDRPLCLRDKPSYILGGYSALVKGCCARA